MRILFKEIIIHNFMSFSDAIIDLENKGFTLISGENHCKSDKALSNGSGKSTIFEALLWCLTGETSRKAKDVSNNLMEDGCYVKLSFTLDGDSYTVIRSKNSKEYKSGIKIFKNSEDISGKGVKDSETILSDLMPEINTDSLTSVIILGQGLPNRFSDNTPSGRKGVLEKLANADKAFNDISSRIAKRKDYLSKELRENEDSSLSLSTKESLVTKQLNDLINSQIGRESVESIIKCRDDKELSLKNLKEHQEALNMSITALDEKLGVCRKNRVDTVSKREDGIKEITEEHSQNISTHRDAIIKSEEKMRILHENIKNAADGVCPTCGQTIFGEHKELLEGWREEALELDQFLQNEKNKYEELVKYRDSLIDEIALKYNTELSNIDVSITVLEQERDRSLQESNKLQRSITECIQTIATLNTRIEIAASDRGKEKETIESLKKDISKIQEEITYINNKVDSFKSKLSIISKINTLVTRDFRGKLLEDVIIYLNNRLQKYARVLFNGSSLSLVLDKNNLDIVLSDKLYESLSGGERRKVDIAVQLALRDTLSDLSDFHSNILVLDEVFDNLDLESCNSVIDLLVNECGEVDSLYIITHHAKELAIPFDREIKVIKDEGGVSTI